MVPHRSNGKAIPYLTPQIGRDAVLPGPMLDSARLDGMRCSQGSMAAIVRILSMSKYVHRCYRQRTCSSRDSAGRCTPVLRIRGQKIRNHVTRGVLCIFPYGPCASRFHSGVLILGRSGPESPCSTREAVSITYSAERHDTQPFVYRSLLVMYTGTEIAVLHSCRRFKPSQEQSCSHGRLSGTGVRA